jgi:hypothetical protein
MWFWTCPAFGVTPLTTARNCCAARQSGKDLHTEFTDIAITLNPDRQSATAFLTVTAKIGGEPDLVVEELKFTFKKISDDWLITALETVKPLR